MGKFSKKRAFEDDEGSGAEVSPKAAKKSKGTTGLETGKDAEGNSYWEIAPKRRVGVSDYKNTTLINIREYYEADGQMKPGKKGISLSLEQYRAFLKAIPAINSQLREAGHTVDDPELVDTAAKVPQKKASKVDANARKANIEATSDEDSD